jgi:hypothetical protein
MPMTKKKPYEDFLKAHLPKVPDFIETNKPRLNPTFELGPPVSAIHDKSLIEMYFPDLRPLVADVFGRPEHYSDAQKAIVNALEQKKPLPHGTSKQDLADIVFRFTEKTEHRKKREALIQTAQKKIEKAISEEEDPTIKKLLEKEQPTFEKQNFPTSIKII